MLRFFQTVINSMHFKVILLSVKPHTEVASNATPTGFSQKSLILSDLLTQITF